LSGVSQNHPDLMQSRFEVEYPSFVAACRAVVEICARIAALSTWRIPASGRSRKNQLEGYLAEIERGAVKPDRETAAFDLLGGGFVTVFRQDGRETLHVQLEHEVGKLDADGRRGVVAQHARFAEALCEGAGGVRGNSTWVGPGADCLPQVPVAGDRSQVVVTDMAEVAGAYDDPDVFWSSWPERREIGGKIVLRRALDAVDGSAFLRAVQDAQWAMARAARPGRTRFGLPRPTAEERPIYRAGTRRLEMVGHDRDQGHVELACAAGPGEHVHGWEILDVWHLLATGKMPNGKAVKSVDVVFLHRETAEAEKRPLLDAGARVLVQSEAGDEVLSP
jgi:hypothetical protein